MLFLKKPLGGTFFEFKESIARQNGALMSFENPYYVRATIKLDEDGESYVRIYYNQHYNTHNEQIPIV